MSIVKTSFLTKIAVGNAAAYGLAVYSLGGIAQNLVKRNPVKATKAAFKWLEAGAAEGMRLKDVAKGINKSHAEQTLDKIKGLIIPGLEHTSYAISPSARSGSGLFNHMRDLGMSGELDNIMIKKKLRFGGEKYVLDKVKARAALRKLKKKVDATKFLVNNPAIASLAPAAAGAAIGSASAGKDRRFRGAVIGGAMGYVAPYAGLKHMSLSPMAKKLKNFDSSKVFNFLNEVLK